MGLSPLNRTAVCRILLSLCYLSCMMCVYIYQNNAYYLFVQYMFVNITRIIHNHALHI